MRRMSPKRRERLAAAGKLVATSTFPALSATQAGAGGRDDMPNLILLCGTGTTGRHGEIHKRHAIDHTLGYWLRTEDSPTGFSVWYCAPASTAWYLHDDGSLSEEPQQ